MVKLAIIGGTGVSELPGLEPRQRHQINTRYGDPSGELVEGLFAGSEVVFLARHGQPHRLPPHAINYRANLCALVDLGVDTVIATNAVGSLRPEWTPSWLVIPHQIIDYTWGREHSIYEGRDDALDHIDFTHPYDSELRQRLLDAAASLDMPHAAQGVYAATQGPRLETAAEINRLRRDGCDIVGMTAMPEASLARELCLKYAAVCTVVNPAAGIGEEPLTLDAMRRVIEETADPIAKLLVSVLPELV